MTSELSFARGKKKPQRGVDFRTGVNYYFCKKKLKGIIHVCFRRACIPIRYPISRCDIHYFTWHPIIQTGELWIQWWIQGRGPGGPPLPLFLDQTEAWKAKENFFGDRVPLISGSGWPPPPFLKVLGYPINFSYFWILSLSYFTADLLLIL